MKRFDPYHTWLGIPPEEQPPNHYRLLGISLFESDREVIRNAADQRMTYLKTYGGGVHSELSQKLLNEVSAAKVCLLNHERKSAYDAWLRQQLKPSIAEPVPTESVEPVSEKDEQLPPVVTKPKRVPPVARRKKDRSFPRRDRPRLPVLGIVVALALVFLCFWLIFRPDYGTLTLTIEPVGVPRDIHVKVDGKLVKKLDCVREPLEMKVELEPGKRDMVVSSPDFQTMRRSFTIQRREERSVSLTVGKVRQICGVKIVLRPPTADVRVSVDGDPIETSRLKDRLELDRGEHELHVSGPGYLDVKRPFVVKSGRKILPVLLVPAGTVKIRFSEPYADVQMKIDGELVAVPDIGSALKLKAGQHRMSVAGRGYQTVNRDFIIEQGKQTVLDVRLKRDDSDPSRVSDDEPPLALAPFDMATAQNHQRAWAEYLGMPLAKDIDVGEGVSMSFVLIPPGEFMMGSSDPAEEVVKTFPDSKAEWLQDEHPQHRVRITKPFYLGAYEVTQRQYEEVMGKNPSSFTGDRNRPVEQVLWYDAIAFCDKLSEMDNRYDCRLPTEAEWEYACRAGTNTRYCFGDDAADLGKYAWFSDNSRSQTHPVGEKRPNAWGLYDIHGNVWEWCADWYDAQYYQHSPSTDPSGPSSGSYRVDRGGGWNYNARRSRSADRFRDELRRPFNDLGFRVVLTLANK